jgi:hypothetical protein
MAKRVYVTSAQKNAARMAVKTSRVDGPKSRSSVLKIARAKPARVNGAQVTASKQAASGAQVKAATSISAKLATQRSK